ncbi:MAG: hypothetical protein JNK04_24995 [Myxococcales bacterium]|nr:hypothetical protein [Myxococcales bacterium]
MKALPLAIGLLLTLSGCGPHMFAVSTPPPTRSGAHRVDVFDEDHIKISRGIALAFDCADIWTGAPCSIASLQTEDKKIAQVYPAFLEREKTPWGTNVEPRSAFVLAGIAPGETVMTVVSDSGTRNVVITVE